MEFFRVVGIEPTNYGVKSHNPMVSMAGVEPAIMGPKPIVLPLDYMEIFYFFLEPSRFIY